jgi:HEAT repeat protein
MKDEWPGQDEWFISLLGNPKLSVVSEVLLAAQRFFATYRYEIAPYPATTESIMDHYGRIARPEMTPLSTALSLNPDKWIPLVAGLTDHKEPAVRNAAISSLAEFLNNDEADKKDRESAARALLPWLTNPDWASAPGRYDLFIGLSKIDLPKSAPYLLQALDNAEEDYIRKAVVEALARHCDPRTAPALRNFLPKESDTYIRWKIVIALARCGGFSDVEMAAAIEAYADTAATAEGQQTIKETLSRESGKTFPLNVMVGKTLFESDMSWATEGFAAILFDGLKELNPVAAKLILGKVRALPLNIARVKLIERIGKESANLADLKLALRDRASLVADLRGELSDLVKRGGYAGGIAAIVLGDHNSQMEILKGKDLQAQIALLAGARYLIEKLPIDLLGDLIARPDKNLAQAVENYLEVEGGAAARKLILARHSNEKQIMGDISSLADYQKELGDLKIWEEKLRAETLAPGGAEEIYALAPAVPSKRLKSLVIRVRQGKAEISIYDAEGNRKLREMDESEFRELKEFTSRPEVEGLGPESWRIKKPIVPYEYLCLTKEGGKRVILTGYRSAPKSPSLQEKLADIFYRIGNSGEYKQ